MILHHSACTRVVLSLVQDLFHHKYEFLWGGCLLTTLRYIDGKGLQRICGGADLKGSQHYPRLFGQAVAQLYQREADGIQQVVKEQRKLGSESPWLSVSTTELIEICLCLRDCP